MAGKKINELVQANAVADTDLIIQMTTIYLYKNRFCIYCLLL